MVKEPDEAKIRARILQVLSRKIKDVPRELRRSQLHKMIGCSIKADYLGALMEKMRVEQLIDWRPAEYSGNWSVWDHPNMIRQRAWVEKCKQEHEEWWREWEASPYRKAQRAQEAKERFQKRLEEFFVLNEEALFDLIQKIYYAYNPEGADLISAGAN